MDKEYDFLMSELERSDGLLAVKENAEREKSLEVFVKDALTVLKSLYSINYGENWQPYINSLDRNMLFAKIQHNGRFLGSFHIMDQNRIPELFWVIHRYNLNQGLPLLTGKSHQKRNNNNGLAIQVQVQVKDLCKKIDKMDRNNKLSAENLCKKIDHMDKIYELVTENSVKMEAFFEYLNNIKPLVDSGSGSSSSSSS